jgi:hypothetical protein
VAAITPITKRALRLKQFLSMTNLTFYDLVERDRVLDRVFQVPRKPAAHYQGSWLSRISGMTYAKLVEENALRSL